MMLQRYAMRPWILATVVFAVAVGCMGQSVASDGAGRPSKYEPRYFPFDGPEKVEYQASWSGIPVGRAKIVARTVWQGGKKHYAVQIKARTLSYLDPFWKMRDSIETVMDADTLRPRRFYFKQNENSKNVKTEALFDPKTNKWVVDIRERKKVKRHEFTSADTLDPISASYLVRSLDFHVGDQFQLTVFAGGKKRYPLDLDVVSREYIAIRTGLFEAYKIHTRLELPGKPGEPATFREAQVWLSADDRRVLLKMSSYVFLGNFNIELVAADPPGRGRGNQSRPFRQDLGTPRRGI